MVQDMAVKERYDLGPKITFLAAIAPALLLLVAALLFVPVLSGYWLADDFAWVRDFLRYDWRDVPRLFLGDWSRAASNEYRPLWALSFMVDLRLWGADPRALHATNIALHVAACALVYFLAKSATGGSRTAGLLSLAFFALAPIHDEPVAWISARGHILAPVFILGALILFRRFEQHGGTGIYLASIAAAIAALATQEVAVALPALLLLRDIADAPRPSRRWLLRMAALHAPFWALLAAYLGFRMVIFGRLGRDSVPSSALRVLQATYASVRTLWLSPTTLLDAPAGLATMGVQLLLILLILVLFIAPFVFLRKNGMRDHARGLIYFAAGWPVITTTVLLGANSPRHFYLASVGPAIALGLAGARFLTSRRLFAVVGSGAVVLLLAIYGFALASGVAGFALNGERSRQLKYAVDTTIARAAPDTDAIVVVIPELSDNNRVFWDYFYPDALASPFTDGVPSSDLIPSFASCHCAPQEWMSDHSAALARITRGAAGPIYVVEWSADQAAFVTRVHDQADFWKAGYAAPGGSLVRPRWPGMPSPALQLAAMR